MLKSRKRGFEWRKDPTPIGTIVRTISRLGDRAEVIVRLPSGGLVTKHIRKHKDGLWYGLVHKTEALGLLAPVEGKVASHA